MGQGLDWGAPIETVPDERNPEPVACEVVSTSDSGRVVKILGSWFNCKGSDHGNLSWDWCEPRQREGINLPLLRNRKEAAAIPEAAVGFEQVCGALRWIYVNGMQPDPVRPKAVSDAINEAFASHRIAQPGMPDPRPGEGTPKPASTGEGERQAWFARNADRRNPIAHINTDPAYFASECADAIMRGTLTAQPSLSSGDDRLREAVQVPRMIVDQLLDMEASAEHLSEPASSELLAIIDGVRTALSRQPADTALTLTESRCVAIADQVVPRYRDETRPALSCGGTVARMWQAAYDGAWRCWAEVGCESG